MRQDLDFKFRTSISREGYEDKDTAKMCLSSITAKKVGREKMAFKEQEVTVDEFLDYAISGHAFCNLYRFDENKKYWVNSSKDHSRETYPVYKVGANKGYFKLSFKSDEFFYGSQTIFVDIDFTYKDSLIDYASCLSYQPTCAYYSYSDSTVKNGVYSRRFRLVYVFDEVLNGEEFRDITYTLYDSIVRDTEEPMYDDCGCSYCQYMNGGNKKETYNTSYIYSKEDFPIYDIPEEEYYQEEKGEEEIAFTRELINDITYCSYEHVVRKWYAKGLRYFTRTELDFGDNSYMATTPDFVKLVFNKNKILDGNQRRRKLYVRAALRRLMKPDVTADELLYNLYIDRDKFFDNSDNVLTLDVLQNKVKGALRTNIKEIKMLASFYDKPKFVINPEEENKRKAVSKARTEITNNMIGNLYDVNATVKENQTTMAKAGIRVSLSRLYKWCEDNKVTPIKPKERNKKAVLEGYNPSLSVRENMKAMNCTMHQVLKAKKAYTA